MFDKLQLSGSRSTEQAGLILSLALLDKLKFVVFPQISVYQKPARKQELARDTRLFASTQPFLASFLESGVLASKPSLTVGLLTDHQSARRLG
jgi:uncharacterized membrane protein